MNITIFFLEGGFSIQQENGMKVVESPMVILQGIIEKDDRVGVSWTKIAYSILDLLLECESPLLIINK